MKDVRKSILEELRQNKINEVEALKKMLLAIEKEQKEQRKNTHEKFKNINHDKSL